MTSGNVVVPAMQSGGNLSVQTAVSGTDFVSFASQPCLQLALVNNTGVTIEFRQDGGGPAIPVINGSVFPLYGLKNANQIAVRRVDTQTTQVTVHGRWEGGWSPLAFGANLVAWWDASDTMTLTLDGSNGVSTWASKVGSFTMSQGTAAARPIHSATGWDGLRPAITGDGLATNGDILSVSGGPFASMQTVFIAAERGTQQDEASSGVRPLFSTAQASGGSANIMGVMRPTTDPAQTQFVASGLGSGGTASTAPDGWSIGTKAVLFAQFSANDIRARVGNGTAGSAAAAGTTVNTTTTVNVFGSATLAARRFTGKIAEVLVVNREVTDQERQSAVEYLAAKWGI